MPQIYSPPLDPPASETDYLRWEREPEWYRPDYDRSITSVVPTMLNLLGISTGELPTLLHHLPESSPRRSRKPRWPRQSRHSKVRLGALARA